MEETHSNIHCIYSSADHKKKQLSPEPEAVEENGNSPRAHAPLKQICLKHCDGAEGGNCARQKVFKPTQITELSREVSLVYKDSTRTAPVLS